MKIKKILKRLNNYEVVFSILPIVFIAFSPNAMTTSLLLVPVGVALIKRNKEIQIKKLEIKAEKDLEREKMARAIREIDNDVDFTFEYLRFKNEEDKRAKHSDEQNRTLELRKLEIIAEKEIRIAEIKKEQALEIAKLDVT